MESVYAHMMITGLRVAHFIRSEDYSSERHTGDYLAGEQEDQGGNACLYAC